jgi:hypothetical protein
MELNKITAEGKLAFPIRWAERSVVRKANESDEEWAKREGQTTFEPLIWAYHTPIGREVFESNYSAIAAANMKLFGKGQIFAQVSGPIIATLALRDAAKADAIENGVEIDGDPATPVLAEIKRLTMIIAPSAQGYDTVPVDVALSRNLIDAEDWKEAESAIVFFTCGLWMSHRTLRELKRDALASALKGSVTSLDPTAFVASLQTSTKQETSAPPEPSSVPS